MPLNLRVGNIVRQFVDILEQTFSSFGVHDLDG